MRLAWISALIAVVAVPAFAQPIAVPSDSRARYEALSVTQKPNMLVEVLTRREGPSGVSFALREVDCRGDRFRYLGEGDTRQEAMRREAQKNTTLAPLFEGSISWHVARFACRSAAR